MNSSSKIVASLLTVVNGIQLRCDDIGEPLILKHGKKDEKVSYTTPGVDPNLYSSSKSNRSDLYSTVDLNSIAPPAEEMQRNDKWCCNTCCPHKEFCMCNGNNCCTKTCLWTGWRNLKPNLIKTISKIKIRVENRQNRRSKR